MEYAKRVTEIDCFQKLVELLLVVSEGLCLVPRLTLRLEDLSEVLRMILENERNRPVTCTEVHVQEAHNMSVFHAFQH